MTSHSTAKAGELDADEVIAAGFRLHGYAQGTGACIAFYRGARWALFSRVSDAELVAAQEQEVRASLSTTGDAPAPVQPGDVERVIAEAVRRAGLTLLKTADGYEVRKLSPAMAQAASPVQPEPAAQGEPSERDRAYDKIDRFLANNVDDVDYAEYSDALDLLYTAPREAAAPVQAAPAGEPTDDELRQRFTLEHGGPNPFYSCKACGKLVPGLREYLAEHATACPQQSGSAPDDGSYVHIHVDQYDRLECCRRMLEIIAVGDSADPAEDARKELEAHGFWDGSAPAASQEVQS